MVKDSDMKLMHSNTRLRGECVTAEVRSRTLRWKLEMGSRNSEDPLEL